MKKSHWQLVDLYPGAHVRVPVGSIHHHGIYVGDGEVVQFGLPTDIGREAKDVKVLRSPIEDFSAGATFVEVYVYDRKEKRAKRKDDEIVQFALSKVGEGGYDLLRNNCEHFANLCVFGVAKSEQIDSVYANVVRLLENNKKET